MEIRTVTRLNLPETNSSSSHSVSISMDKSKYDKKLLNFPILDGNRIFIPTEAKYFGWEWEKYNDALTKTQYVLGIYMRGIEEGNSYKKLCRSKKISRLKKIIKDFTGASDVIFEWEEKIKEDPGYEISVIGIDHNSSEIFDEITESIDTLKDFIFNPDSWLYLGNDNSDPADSYEFYKERDFMKPNATAWIEFPKPYGVVDFEIYNFPSEFISYDLPSADLDILESAPVGEGFKLDFSLSSIIFPGGDQFAIYISKDLSKKLDSLRIYGKEDRKKYLEDNDCIEGKDYKRFKINYKSLELGEI